MLFRRRLTCPTSGGAEDIAAAPTSLLPQQRGAASWSSGAQHVARSIVSRQLSRVTIAAVAFAVASEVRGVFHLCGA